MKCRLIVLGFALVALVAAALLSAPAAPQNRTASREVVCCSNNEELQNFYWDCLKPRNQLPARRTHTPI